MKLGFMSALALLFIGLKLGHIIAWPWAFVLAPLWIPLLISLAFFTAISVIKVIAS